MNCHVPSQTVDVDATGEFSVTYTVQRFMTTSGLTRMDSQHPR